MYQVLATPQCLTWCSDNRQEPLRQLGAMPSFARGAELKVGAYPRGRDVECISNAKCTLAPFPIAARNDEILDWHG